MTRDDPCRHARPRARSARLRHLRPRCAGRRDPGNALVFASGANRAALLQRMLYDMSDAMQFGRRKRKVGAGALAAAALGAAGLLGSS